MGVKKSSATYSALGPPAVPVGYKQTEVGVIPEDWHVLSLSEAGSPVRGGSPRPAGDSRFFNGSFIPWLTVAALTNISESVLVVSSTETSLTEEGALRSRTLLPGTLIIANSGATLGVAKILGIKCCANDGIAAVINLRPDVSPRYLAYFINSKTKLLREVVAPGNGQPNLNTGLIGAVNVPVPEARAEQEAIAAALHDADSLIEALSSLMAKKRRIKQGAMEALLTGKQRLPGFCDEWIDVRIGELGSCHRGVSYNPETDLATADRSDTVRLFRSSNIVDGVIVYEGLQFVHKRCVAEHQLLRPGDVLICTANGSRGLVGKAAAFLSVLDEKYTFGAFMGCFRPNENAVHTAFAPYLFDTGSYRAQLDVLLAGSSINNLAPASVEGLWTRIPSSFCEQVAIAKALSDMDAELTALEARLAKARQLKQGIMQQLLTGRIRLPLDEAA